MTQASFHTRQQFERAVGSESVAGLGLGLFISDQIVKAHGGRIEVQSSLGQGSLFSVWLPRGKRVEIG